MTEVAFHFNAHDPVAYCCRLLRKAVSKGARVAVTGERASLQRFDIDLWTFSAVDFVPHCRAGAAPPILEATPIVLCESPETAPHHEVLLNLGAAVPAGFERFERLIEVVGLDEEQRAQARLRWKHYQDRGYAISRHDIAPGESH